MKRFAIAMTIGWSIRTASTYKISKVPLTSFFATRSRHPKIHRGQQYHPSRLWLSSASPITQPTSTDAPLPVVKDFLEPIKTKRVPKKFVPFPFEYHQEVEVTVSSLTNLGLGVCRYNSTSNNSSSSIYRQEDVPENVEPVNWVIMVPGVIPGEVVRVRIYKNFSGHSVADLIEVVEPSSDRVNPVCRFSDECGGCQYQHMSIKAQREWKRKHMMDLMRQNGLDFVEVQPTCGTDQIFGYRSKLTPHYDAPKKSKVLGPIGFLQQGVRKLVDVPRCEIATDLVNQELVKVRANLTQQCAEGTLRRPHKGATMLLREVDGPRVATDPRAIVNTTVVVNGKSIVFQHGAGNFFQNNPFLLPVMVEKVVAEASAPVLTSSTETLPMTHLIDCYCGSGLFGLSASPRFESCVGIEISASAVEEATANAARNGIKNCEFVAATAETIFRHGPVPSFPRRTTAVLVDPPRSGCSPEFLEQLLEYRPQRILYVSCDPATQARDAAILCVDEAYVITHAMPFDLFPQTRHIESFIVFELKAHPTMSS